MERELFVNIAPISKRLSKYIHSFTLSVKEATCPTTYIAFPNLGTCLAFFNQTKVCIEETHVSFSKDKGTRPSIILLGRAQFPVSVTFNDPVEEIAINFTACGINYFFDVPFYQIAQQAHQVLTNHKWTNFAAVLFAAPAPERLALLEDFLLTCLNEENKEILEKIYTQVSRNEIQQVKELANLVHMSERNLLRYFKDYFGCSPSAFNKIRRFRSAIGQTYNGNGYPKKFYDESTYFDLAHFRKDFRQFTGAGLTQFYKALFLVGNGGSPFQLK
ncbi:helix-turn-helix domain-containing protein [Pedobacter sp. KR3-3]|uniref:Helix-turn-helix domain-containing protein n=1 Tax=Pedobacter albus TaxID=3113905 RepID=A0ABU7I7Q2_9SPHI|nr:helix-turn-helix domain-containing protein [Pedobacter sp. KR3-3]MEE1945494.1 helix-turn-helix domain-containing protein [Pedobacter sp. KR3-3]